MVSLDKPERNLEFATSLDGNFPLLSDPEKTTATAYGTSGFLGLFARRWTFYIDVEGVIRYIDKDVNTETAGQDIAKRLETLGFPKRNAPESTGGPGPDIDPQQQ